MLRARYGSTDVRGKNLNVAVNRDGCTAGKNAVQLDLGVESATAWLECNVLLYTFSHPSNIAEP